MNFDHLDVGELWLRMQLSAIERAALIAFDGRPVAAERARIEAGYGRCTPFNRCEPTKYDSELARDTYNDYLRKA